MGACEWLLTAMVIVVPLVIAAVVTLWSLEQVRYRPKRRPGVAATQSKRLAGAGSESNSLPDEPVQS